MKIIIITNIPSPYRIPLFNQMNEDFNIRGWRLKVIFLTRGYARRKWVVFEKEFNFEYEYLKDWHVANGEGFRSLALSLFPALYKNRPNHIVVAGFSLATLWTLIYSKMFQIPFIIWSGETIAEDRMRSKSRNLRNILRRILVQSATAFVVYGTEAKKYLLTWQVDPKKIFIGINTVDTEFIHQRVKELRFRKKELIAERQLPNLNILFIGYLENRKGVHFILEAVKKIQKESPSLLFGTHIVGSGPEEDNLRKTVENDKLHHVYFWGFKQKEEIPEFLALSNLLLFTSTQELYGLVPIEAMAAGVPTLCSVYAGCAVDLIKDHVNGIIIDPANVDEIEKKIIYCLKNPDFLHTLAHNAQEYVLRNFSLKNSAKGFADAILSVKENSNTVL